MAYFDNTYDRYIQIGKITFHYLEFGGCGKTILFLSGLGDSAYSFIDFAPSFVPQYRTLAFTRRGFGKTDVPESGYDIETLTKDIRSFLDRLDIWEVILVGHSIAGYEIVQFAVEYPDRVRKVVFLDAAYERDVEFVEISKNDPISVARNKKAPEDVFYSLEKYKAYYKELHPNFSRLWCPALETLFLERVRVQEDGSVTKISKSSIKNELKRSLFKVKLDYSKVRANILAIYPFQFIHPYLPRDADASVRRLGNAYNAEYWIPYTEKNIAKLKNESQNAKIIRIRDADHYCHISHRSEVATHIMNFIEDTGTSKIQYCSRYHR